MYIIQVIDQRTEFAKLPVDQKRAMAQATIQSQEFRALVAKDLADTLSPNEQVETEDDAELKTLTDERKELAKGKKESKQKVKKTQKELDKLQKAEGEHQPGGTRSVEIQTLAAGLN